MPNVELVLTLGSCGFVAMRGVPNTFVRMDRVGPAVTVEIAGETAICHNFTTNESWRMPVSQLAEAVCQ